MRIAQDPEGDRVQAITDGMHETRERVAVPCLRQLDEPSVHPSLRVPANTAGHPC